MSSVNLPSSIIIICIASLVLLPLSSTYYESVSYEEDDFYDEETIREFNLTSNGFGNKKYGDFSYHKKYFEDPTSDLHFSYEMSSSIGPLRWKDKYPSCGNGEQSPINLELSFCDYKKLPKPLRYYKSKTIPENVTLENSGYSIEFTFDYKVQRPLLFGGPFKSPYIFEMIHFHWGPLKDSGSEHFINSKSYHMEMHVTHRHPRYRDMTEAAKYKNGIVVLAFLFEVSHKVTDSPLFSSVRQLRMVNSSVLFRGFPSDYMLSEFVGDLDEELIAYRGSLSTPPCSHASWIVAKTIRKISTRDLRSFRQALGLDGHPIAPNYRPLQKRTNLHCLVF